MTEHIVKILHCENVTHDVKRFVVERPAEYFFIPGQATEVSINKAGWTKKKRPFTFTGLTKAHELEFTIKIYDDHKGVTSELGKLNPGDELIIRDSWGAISFKGEGVFIAAGAGITPFIAILKGLHQKGEIRDNILIFSNKTSKDIILDDEFEEMFPKDNYIKVLTREQVSGIHYGRINAEFLKENVKDFSKYFYICGPEEFVKAMNQIVVDLGASAQSVVIEK